MRRLARGEGGQAVVFIAIVMLAMIMMAGLAIDAGQLFVARRTMQEAGDAAAYAAAVTIYQGGTQAQAASAAVADAQRNGYVNGVGGFTVTVNAPPASGPYANNNNYVEVLIQGGVQTSLVPGGNLTTVKVRGVAGAAPLNNGYAIMALDRGNTPNAVQVASTGHVTVSGAGILVNSTSTSAANLQLGGTVSVTPSTQPAPYVAGNVAGTWPNPQTSKPQQPDPFAGYPKPSTSGLPVCNTLASCQDVMGHQTSGIYTVSLSGAGGTTITLNSGIYILKAGVNATGNSDFVSAAGGVFIFNTVMNYPTDTLGGCGAVILAGTNVTTLSAMTTGTYKGLLFYQDTSCTASMTISGNGTLNATGTIYLPNAAITLNGNNATLTGSQIVAKTVNVGSGTVTISFDAATTAQPTLPRLSE